MTFDFPDSSRSCTRRERATTPLQALNLLNDPAYFEAAQALATRIWNQSPGENTERLNQAFLLTLSRLPLPDESKRLLAYLQQQKALFGAEDASVHELLKDTPTNDISAERAAWVALASVLLNLDEFITRE